MIEDKTIVAVVAIVCVTILQVVAWTCGYNGAVFALTSSVIGGIVGFFLGFKINIESSIAEYVHKNPPYLGKER